MTVKNGNSDHIACNRFESIRDEEGMEREGKEWLGLDILR